MLSMKNGELPDVNSLISALAAWILVAPLFLVIAALLANGMGMGEQGIACLSSAVSFFCAAAAGFAGAKKRKQACLAYALILATMLVIVLLTAGFLINGETMVPSSILSLVSFSYAGVLVGVFILFNPGKTRAKRTIYERN